MIRNATGNLLQAEAEALINTVNCDGFMGKGIALQFKQAWPGNFDAYAKACRAKEVRPGKMFIWETGRMVNPRYIVNFPTKRHWREKSLIEDIRSGLRALREHRRSSGSIPSSVLRARRADVAHSGSTGTSVSGSPLSSDDRHM